MKKWFLLLILTSVAVCQQVNSDIIPATSGLNLGHSNQTWNGFFNNVTITGTCTLNTLPCFSGGGGGGTGNVPLAANVLGSDSAGNIVNNTTLVSPALNAVSTQILYNSVGTPTGASGWTWNATNNVPVLSLGSITTDINPFSRTWTYNSSGTGFNGEIVKVTNTASANGSLIRQWCVASSCETLSTGLNYKTTGTVSSGVGTGVAGYVAFVQGTSPSGNLTLNSAGWFAGTSIPTAYGWQFPSAECSAAGFPALGAASSHINVGTCGTFSGTTTTVATTTGTLSAQHSPRIDASGNLADNGPNTCPFTDNAICSSSLDANGNPNYLATAGSTALPINGGTTPLTMFIGGVYQVLGSNITLTVPSTTGQYWILAEQDLSTPLAMVAADFVASATPPVYDRSAPTCPTNPQGIAVSATNPAFFFNVSTNQSFLCTSNGGTYNASPAIAIGLVDVTGCGSCTIDGVVGDSYRLSPQKRYARFGYGSGGNLGPVTTTVAVGQVSAFTLGAGGTNYAINQTNTIILQIGCGAQTTATSNGSGVITAVAGSPTVIGSNCISGSGQATTCLANCGTGSGATVGVTNVFSTPNFPLSLVVLSGGSYSGTNQYIANGGAASNRAMGTIIMTPNPVLVLGTGIIAASIGKGNNGAAGSAVASEAGGLGGMGGSGAGGSTGTGGIPGCELKWSTNLCTDQQGSATPVNTAGSQQVWTPPVTSPNIIPHQLTGNCSLTQGAGSAGGGGGGDGTHAGGSGGGAGQYLCILAPSMFVAAGASINANGANGGNGAASGANDGGGGGGGGGLIEILVGFASGITRNTSSNLVSNGGTGGTGVGTGCAGGPCNGGAGQAGMIFFQDGIQN